MNELFKAIVIKGLRIRKSQGERPEDILDGYTKLTETERADILAMVMQEEHTWEKY